MRVMGIDPGLTGANPTGVVILDTAMMHLVEFGELVPPKRLKNFEDRLKWIIINLSGRLQSLGKPDLIACETPWLGPNAQTGLKLAYLVGGVMSLAAEHGITYVGVLPASAKKALTGSGKADKLHMLIAADEQFKCGLHSKHVSDAIGVAMSGWQRMIEQTV